MIPGQTARSRAYRRRKVRRPDIDPQAVRYMVYRLHDEAGEIVYVGRSCDVTQRLRAHHAEASGNPDPRRNRKASWFFRVRRVSMRGPYTWDEACRVEREEIEAHQPVGNIALTARDHRPFVAHMSAARANTS